MPIINKTKQVNLASYVEIADNPFTRMKGLLGKLGLSEGYAFVIKPCNSIHMLFMKFAIDVIFVDQKNIVIGLVEQIKPFEFSPVFWKSSCAIELPAGTIKKSQTQLNDQLTITSSW
jgi:uncharacterized membrane protein (UPF0127 family)